VLFLAAFPVALYAQSPSVLEVGKFSAAPEGAALPDGWKPLTFKKIEKHTAYTVVKDGETGAVKAVSERRHPASRMRSRSISRSTRSCNGSGRW